MSDWRLTYHRSYCSKKTLESFKKYVHSKPLSFFSPPCPSMFILYVTPILPPYIFALVSYPNLSQKWQCYLHRYLYDNKKNIYKSQKKVWQNEDRFDPPPFVRFCLLFKITHPPPPYMMKDEPFNQKYQRSI